MWLPPPSSSPRKYSLPPASTDRCTRNRSSSTTTVTSQNWPHRYCETIATGSGVPPSRMAVGDDGAAPGSVRARLDGRFDMVAAAITGARWPRARWWTSACTLRNVRKSILRTPPYSKTPRERRSTTEAVVVQDVARPHLGAGHRSITTGSAATHGVRKDSRDGGVCGARARARYTTFAIRRHVS